MVVAEIPLWAVHSSGPAGSRITEVNDRNHGDGDKDPISGQTSKANESLSLLESLAGGAMKCAIYSVDMHPSGKKFASAGGDGAVRIWSTTPLFAKHRASFAENGHYVSSESDGAENADGAENNPDEEIAEKDNNNDADKMEIEPTTEARDLNQLVRRKKDDEAPSSPSNLPAPMTPGDVSSPARPKPDASSDHRLLCTLSAHTGSSVLAVRFSATGNYLASAGDDAVVCVYAPSSSSMGNLSENVEHWSRVKLCRGHTLDVVGLAWAPDDSHLVSCSLDSDAPVIVWRLTDLDSQERRTQANVLCNPYKILGKDDHTSTVKGVTFDPAGSYLASSGDDPAVCIWRAHDDWGLEKKIDASSGIFRRWREDDARELSSQTLFRRLSWSTDGTYICSTNASIKNRHVASTISREGWSVSVDNTSASGAANLVGHKQPIVVSRHCPVLIDARKKNADGEFEDDEPDYATLVALGDKSGFVTVWSTRKSRPIFKLQCSESRCTVTDLTWGRVDSDIFLLVSLMDGHIVALKFGVPKEVGQTLSDSDQKRVFELRYGIDFDDDNGLGRRRMFVGDNSAPKLIENALQFELEDQSEDDFAGTVSSSDDDVPLSSLMTSSKVKETQTESRSKGKKRIQPVLLTVPHESKKSKINGHDSKAEKKKKSDPVKDALESAARAASAAEDVAAKSTQQSAKQKPTGESQRIDQQTPVAEHFRAGVSGNASLQIPRIPCSTERVHTVDLPRAEASEPNGDDSDKLVADCTNATRVPSGSSGQSVPCITISITRAGKATWRDEIVGSSCSALAISKALMAVGTTDGCVYLYGTSSSLGWSSGTAFRSFPALVFGPGIVFLHFTESEEARLELVVVASDGSFGVYTLIPETTLQYKGSILGPMTHMVLACGRETQLPQLARIQTTESGRLLMMLSLEAPVASEGRAGRSSSALPSVGAGGSLQAFVYNRAMETWMRVSDSRFLLSDFYSTLPKSKGASTSSKHVLAKLDDAVRSGASASSIKPSRRGRNTNEGSSSMLSHSDLGANLVSRSHCEDRLACALVLGSALEFKMWLSLYVRILAKSCNETQLRTLFDMLLVSGTKPVASSSTCWWLSSATTILNLDRHHLLKAVVVPEMSKNRTLQRLTNELSLEIEQL